MFKRPDLKTIMARIASDITGEMGGAYTRLRRRALTAVGKALAGAVHEQYGYLDHLALQIHPDTCDEDILLRLGGRLRLERKPAAPASEVVPFTGNDGCTIPSGTILQRPDGFEYQVSDDVVIENGSANATITATEAGTAGNCPAQTPLSLTSPITGVNPELIAVNGIDGGADIEDIERYRQRYLDRLAKQYNGCNAEIYEAWAKEIPGVTRAWCYEKVMGPGTVGVCFVCDTQEDIIPDSAKIAEVAAYIEKHTDPITGQNTGRPPCADVHVYAPKPVPQNFEIQIFPETDSVKAAVTAEIEDLLETEVEPGGMIKVSHIREVISRAAGETDSVLVSPIGNIVRSAGEITVMGEITWV